GHKSSGASRIDAVVEQDRGPFNGRAAITGTAVDQWGGALEGASVRLRDIQSGKTRVASVGADGRFTLAGLTPGNYEIEVVSDSDKVSTKLTLQARDQAVLSVLLRQEAAGVVTAVRDSFGVVTRLRGDMAGGAFGAFADMEVGRKAIVFIG